MNSDKLENITLPTQAEAIKRYNNVHAVKHANTVPHSVSTHTHGEHEYFYSKEDLVEAFIAGMNLQKITEV